MTSVPPISRLVPHAPPMLLLERVVSFDGAEIVCEATVGPGPFMVAGKLPAVVSLEFMAQTCAAWVGMKGRDLDSPSKGGFLLGTRELSLRLDSFGSGDDLRITARHVWGEEAMASFDAAIERAGERVAWATLNVLRHT